jgi:hypothetical protein
MWISDEVLAGLSITHFDEIRRAKSALRSTVSAST